MCYFQSCDFTRKLENSFFLSVVPDLISWDVLIILIILFRSGTQMNSMKLSCARDRAASWKNEMNFHRIFFCIMLDRSTSTMQPYIHRVERGGKFNFIYSKSLQATIFFNFKKNSCCVPKKTRCLNVYVCSLLLVDRFLGFGNV